MIIQLSPEDEKIIQEWLRTGAFQTVEESVHYALEIQNVLQIQKPQLDLIRRKALKRLERAAKDLENDGGAPTNQVSAGTEPHRNVSPRSSERAWLKEHQAEYKGAWVALENDRLVAQGLSAKQVLDAAQSEGCEQPLVVHIPSQPELPFGGW